MSNTRDHPLCIPDVTFHVRARNKNKKKEKKEEFVWEHRTSSQFFSGKRVVIIGVPAAFSPVCTDHHLEDYEQNHDKIIKTGADEVWCTSVNDPFVMFQWGKSMGVKKVGLLPDGNGDFARQMGMLVRSGSKGYGHRSWRYAMIVDDLRVEAVFEEPGKMDDCPVDPFTQSMSSQGVIPYLLKNIRTVNPPSRRLVPEKEL